MRYRIIIEGQGEVRRPTIYWHKNRRESRVYGEKQKHPNKNRTRKRKEGVAIRRPHLKDSTCADLTYNKTESEAVEIVKGFQQLIEITMDLKRVLGCNRLRWLRGKDEIERERIQGKSVDVIVEVLDPLLKALKQQVNGRE